MKLFTLKDCSQIIHHMESVDMWKSPTDGTSYSAVDFIPEPWVSSKIIEYAKTQIGIDITNIVAIGLKYQVGDKFPPHVDRNENDEFHKDFLYNINMLLNTDYEGGEFRIEGNPHLYEPGVVYHYNSSKLHEVTEITKGIRYSVLFYIRERDFNYQKSLL